MPKKLTIEEFISKSKVKHGDMYGYSEVEYITSLNKVNIICKKHGVFEQWYYHHYKEGCGCPKCGKLSAIEILKQTPTGWSHSDWIKSALKFVSNLISSASKISS